MHGSMQVTHYEEMSLCGADFIGNWSTDIENTGSWAAGMQMHIVPPFTLKLTTHMCNAHVTYPM